MLSVTENNEQLKIKILSKKEKINKVIKQCNDFLAKRGISDFVVIEKILKELIENAIIHGNKGEEKKKVTIGLKFVEDNKYKIEVQNQGSGFDHKLLEFNDGVQSGLSLVKSLSEELSFTPKGTKVNVIVTLNKSEEKNKIEKEKIEEESIKEKNIEEEIMQETNEFENFEENGVVVIVPKGDIVSAKANELRLLLTEEIKNGKKLFKFDFSNVEDIDSPALSLFIILPKMLKVETEENRPEIINSTQKITNLFNYTNLNKFYNISGKRG